MERKIPKIMKGIGSDFHWDQKKVWALDIPIEEMQISELEWHFDVPFWNKPNGYYDPFKIFQPFCMYLVLGRLIEAKCLQYLTYLI